MSSTEYRVTLSQLVLVVVLGISLIAIDGYLLFQNYHLRNPAAKVSEILEGAMLLPLEGLDSDGGNVRLVPEAGRKTLLLVFSPVCRFCHQNASSWDRILKAHSLKDLRLVGVSLGLPGSGFLEDYGWIGKLAYIDVSGDKKSTGSAFDSTPLTILLDENGRVEQLWRGVLTESSVSDLENRVLNKAVD